MNTLKNARIQLSTAAFTSVQHVPSALCLIGSRRIVPILPMVKISRCFASQPPFAGKPSSLGSEVPVARQWRERFVNFFRAMVPSKGFSRSNTLSRHIQDNVPVKDWLLIYDDSVGAMFHFVFSAGIILSIYFIIRWPWLMYSDEELRNEFLDDIEYVGPLALLVLANLLCAWYCVLTHQSRALFRIYQNRTMPNKLLIRSTKGSLLRKWMLINRGDISLINGQAPVDEVRSLSQLLNGNVHINGKPYTIKNEPFRDNTYRSYVLNLKDTVPRDLSTTDQFAAYFKNPEVIRRVENTHNDDDMNVAERIAGPKEHKEWASIKYLKMFILPIIVASAYHAYTFEHQKEKAARRVSRMS